MRSPLAYGLIFSVLVVVIVVALSKALVVAIVAKSILIVIIGDVHLLGVFHSICRPKPKDNTLPRVLKRWRKWNCVLRLRMSNIQTTVNTGV
jgi:hypothetical protein